MIDKFISAIRGSTAPSGLETYLQSLSVRRIIGGPTIDEARKDYRAALRRRKTIEDELLDLLD